jgi:hypothetical protein
MYGMLPHKKKNKSETWTFLGEINPTQVRTRNKFLVKK